MWPDRKVSNRGQRPVLGFRFGGRLGPKLQCSGLCEARSCGWPSATARSSDVKLILCCARRDCGEAPAA